MEKQMKCTSYYHEQLKQYFPSVFLHQLKQIPKQKGHDHTPGKTENQNGGHETVYLVLNRINYQFLKNFTK